MAGVYTGSLVTVALILGIAWTDGIHSFAGPYIVRYESIIDCPESTDEQGRHQLRISHFNPNKPFEMQTATGNVTLKRAINGTMKVSSVIDIRSNNQWKINYFVLNHTKEDMCGVILRVCGRNNCLVEPGTFSFDRATLPKSYTMYRIVPYGHYRMRLQVGKESDIAYCSHTELHYIPRP